MYKICWKNEKNLFEGQGRLFLSLKSATSWINYLNKKYPTIIHWIADKNGKDLNSSLNWNKN